MTLQRDNPLPLFHQLKTILCARIHAQELAIGDPLPSVRALIDEFSVSLPVVRQALMELQHEGVVHVERGKGTFVRKLPGRVVDAQTAVDSVLFVSCLRAADDPYLSWVLRGVQEAAAQSGKQVVYGHPTAERPLARLLAESDAQGFILSGGIDKADLELALASSKPFVLCGDVRGVPVLPASVSAVGSDDLQGGYAGTQHLIHLGHKRIATILGPTAMPFWARRLEGYRTALSSANLPFDPTLVVELTAEDAEGVGPALESLRKRHDAPTAVFALSGPLAQAIYAHLHATHRSIPADLSVVAFASLPVCDFFVPRLTAIVPNVEATGRRSFEMLERVMSRSHCGGERIVLPIELRQGDSTRRLRRNP